MLGELLLAKIRLARGYVAGASAALTQVERFARQHNFTHRLPDLAALRVRILLHPADLSGRVQKENLAEAAQLAQTYELPLSQARVHLAAGDPSAALAVLEPLRREMEAKAWADELLRLMVLQSVALFAHSDAEAAVGLLQQALVVAEPGGFIRLFIDEGDIDEGSAMAQLLRQLSRRAAPSGATQEYARKLLALMDVEQVTAVQGANGADAGRSVSTVAQPLVEPLSERELEVLHLVAQGLSNREIGERLFLALDTIKGHNRRIYGKLQVNRRTEAVAKARELGLV